MWTNVHVKVFVKGNDKPVQELHFRWTTIPRAGELFTPPDGTSYGYVKSVNWQPKSSRDEHPAVVITVLMLT